mmetsp:Transcript_50640/g.133441  ORF Transcript_50640/g.133441 Transcript_50640/m.133441 type:complete len:549 (-) Transcript_50640:889-2535(-)
MWARRVLVEGFQLHPLIQTEYSLVGIIQKIEQHLEIQLTPPSAGDLNALSELFQVQIAVWQVQVRLLLLQLPQFLPPGLADRKTLLPVHHLEGLPQRSELGHEKIAQAPQLREEIGGGKLFHPHKLGHRDDPGAIPVQKPPAHRQVVLGAGEAQLEDLGADLLKAQAAATVLVDAAEGRAHVVEAHGQEVPQPLHTPQGVCRGKQVQRHELRQGNATIPVDAIQADENPPRILVPSRAFHRHFELGQPKLSRPLLVEGPESVWQTAKLPVDKPPELVHLGHCRQSAVRLQTREILLRHITLVIHVHVLEHRRRHLGLESDHSQGQDEIGSRHHLHVPQGQPFDLRHGPLPPRLGVGAGPPLHDRSKRWLPLLKSLQEKLGPASGASLDLHQWRAKRSSNGLGVSDLLDVSSCDSELQLLLSAATRDGQHLLLDGSCDLLGGTSLQQGGLAGEHHLAVGRPDTSGNVPHRDGIDRLAVGKIHPGQGRLLPQCHRGLQRSAAREIQQAQVAQRRQGLHPQKLQVPFHCQLSQVDGRSERREVRAGAEADV